MRTVLMVLGLAALVVALPGCDPADVLAGSARVREDFHYTEPLSAGGRLSVEGFNGSIELTAWDNPEVDITGTKSASTQELLDEIDIQVVGSGDSVRVQALRPDNRSGNRGVRFQIQAPREVVLELIQTSNGAIQVKGFEGDARLRTSNGSVTVRDLSGDVEARTSNASITLAQFTGSANLQSSNGSINADGIRGYLEAETSNASIDARVAETSPGRPYRLRSSNGSLNLTFDEVPTTDVIARTSNASVRLRLPADAAARLDAETSNSRVSSDFDVAVESSNDKQTRLKGTIGSGGPLLDLDSSNGRISIERN